MMGASNVLVTVTFLITTNYYSTYCRLATNNTFEVIYPA
jgi:hypothetical protein